MSIRTASITGLTLALMTAASSALAGGVHIAVSHPTITPHTPISVAVTKAPPTKPHAFLHFKFNTVFTTKVN